MTEVPRPIPESAQRQHNPVRIISGEVKSDGSFVRPAHQMLYDLWMHEARRREIPGLFRVKPIADPKGHKKSVAILPFTTEDQQTLERLRRQFESGVKQWVEEGEPDEYKDLAKFKEHYITEKGTPPQEETL